MEKYYGGLAMASMGLVFNTDGKGGGHFTRLVKISHVSWLTGLVVTWIENEGFPIIPFETRYTAQ